VDFEKLKFGESPFRTLMAWGMVMLCLLCLGLGIRNFIKADELIRMSALAKEAHSMSSAWAYRSVTNFRIDAGILVAVGLITMLAMFTRGKMRAICSFGPAIWPISRLIIMVFL
jgi:hypothetical protein